MSKKKQYYKGGTSLYARLYGYTGGVKWVSGTWRLFADRFTEEYILPPFGNITN